MPSPALHILDHLFCFVVVVVVVVSAEACLLTQSKGRAKQSAPSRQPNRQAQEEVLSC
jgi:hypothetical protein